MAGAPSGVSKATEPSRRAPSEPGEAGVEPVPQDPVEDDSFFQRQPSPGVAYRELVHERVLPSFGVGDDLEFTGQASDVAERTGDHRPR